ncbi:ATP-dependent nuclease [Pedobacter rhodius]|uniref:AAA family ATPase n=1 Tax=Pedobacter rhodius TaxID=3004098 RepID=A0ABT4KWK1_9SPHI|nr:AAA family ATPase [Pedobacter sp. SJ11]MCZ4223308.1 AAA family ATPase [Pedobacter sp. SJ11]
MSSIKITSLSVKNYRSFGERQDFVFPNVDYTRPVAIIGYNNSGKSNLLNAIKYGLYESIREDSFDLKDFHNCSWENTPCFALKFRADINEDRIVANQEYQNLAIVNVAESRVVSVSDVCSCYGVNSAYGKKWAIKQKAPIYYINFHNIKEEISTQRTSWGNLKSFLAKHIQKLVETDNAMKAKKAVFEDEVKIATDKVLEGSSLTTFIEKIQKNYKANLRNNNCVVDFGLPSYEDIFLKMLFKVGLNGNTDNLIPIEHFGDGFISMFVMAVIQSITETNNDDRYLFLFEEPESFLHENHQEYFYKMVLCGLAEKGHQVIYTTHSDRMIDAFDTKGIIRLEMDENNQTVKAYNNVGEFVDPFARALQQDFEEPINVNRFNEYVKTVEPNLNRMLFSKKVILVEGPNDILVYKEVIRRKVLEAIAQRADIINKNKFADTYLNFENISFVCHHGKATALYIVELCKHFNVDYYVINDWDFEALDVPLASLQGFNDLAALKADQLYIISSPNRKGMLTTNRMLIDLAAPDKIHFNVKRLEEVIGYVSNDKSGLKIWQLIQNPAFVIIDELYPETLNNFLEINKLAVIENNNVVVAPPADQDLPF